jgi:hypothetical protein
VLAEEGVSEEQLRDWLVRHDLALIVTRDQTSRDRSDLQQPFNLRVPGGASTRSAGSPGGKIYDIAHFQLFEGAQLRAYPGRPLSWQSADAAGAPVVRERNWITCQAGEMRVCASCHGVNTATRRGGCAHQPARGAARLVGVVEFPASLMWLRN